MLGIARDDAREVAKVEPLHTKDKVVFFVVAAADLPCPAREIGHAVGGKGALCGGVDVVSDLLAAGGGGIAGNVRAALSAKPVHNALGHRRAADVPMADE